VSKQGYLSNEAAQGELRRQEKHRAAQEADDMRMALSEPWGRRLIWGVLSERCHVWGSSYAGDAHATAFAEGRRAVGIELMQLTQSIPGDLYSLMVHEAMQSRVKEEKASGAAKAITQEDDEK
jgi:hypothetical protein